MDNLGSVTVPNRFLLKAERRQNDTAVKGAFGAFSYRRLSEQAAALAICFSRAGVRPGSTVVFIGESQVNILASLIATALLGAKVAGPLFARSAGAQEKITHCINFSEFPFSGITNITIDHTFDPDDFSDVEKKSMWKNSLADPEEDFLILVGDNGPDWSNVKSFSQREIIEAVEYFNSEFGDGVEVLTSLYPNSSGPSMFVGLAALLSGKEVLEKSGPEHWLVIMFLWLLLIHYISLC